MIPNFRTYLKESVWGDIRKKSLGQEERIENSFNNMSPQELVDFLNENYRFSQMIWDVKNKDNSITIPILRTGGTVMSGWPVSLCYYINKEITFSNKQFGKIFCQKLYARLKNVTNLEHNEDGYLAFIPEDGESVNHMFLISVLDKIVENLDPNEDTILISKK